MTHQAFSTPEEAPLPRVETAEDADELCARLSDTMSELIDVLTQETDLLKRGKAQDIGTLYARKTALSTVLTHDMGRLGRDTEFVKMAAR